MKKAILLIGLLVLIVVLSGCTQSTGQASLSSTQTKTDCPYECCKNLSQYFGKVCALDAECVDNKCVSVEEEVQSSSQQSQLACPSSCNDDNPCTEDFCNESTGYLCAHNNLSEPQTDCSGSAGTCQEYYCSNGTCQTKTSMDCCGNGTCETNENYFSCPRDCQQDCPNLSAFVIQLIESGDDWSSYDYRLYIDSSTQANFNGWIFDYEKEKGTHTGEFVLYCYKGSKKGENIKYYYCKHGIEGWSYIDNYLTKTVTDEDGIIIEAKEISPIIVYDIIDEKNVKYIETICYHKL